MQHIKIKSREINKYSSVVGKRIEAGHRCMSGQVLSGYLRARLDIVRSKHANRESASGMQALTFLLSELENIQDKRGSRFLARKSREKVKGWLAFCVQQIVSPGQPMQGRRLA